MNIYFYDNYSSSYNRFGNKVAEKLVELDSSVKIFYIHDNYDKGKVLLRKKIQGNVNIVTPNKVLDIIKEYPPHSFLCYSFRIPDVYWTTFFNKRFIPTFQVMHGIYITNYKRSVSYVLKDFPRVFSYFKYLAKLITISRNKKNLLINMVKKDVGHVGQSKVVDDITLSKTLILWGEHWKEWFIYNQGYKNDTKTEICGSFDFDLLNHKHMLIENDTDSATYISQTICEDGRISEKLFLEFLDSLYEFAKSCNCTFYIKLHPRSNAAFYSKFTLLENVEITRKFPVSEVYISHYSALLTVPAYLNKKIIMVQFPNHSIPKEYSYFATKIIDHDEKILPNDYKVTSRVDFEKYFKYEDNPFGVIARTITHST